MYMPLRTQHANMVLAEHPVGDPFAGAAFGEMHKSKGLGMVIGVVSGLATAGAGWGMMAAGNGLTLGSLAGGAMFAGGISTALGSVSGNKKLTKIGGILSLGGGIGSLGADMIAGQALGSTASAGWSETMSQLEGAFGSVMGTGGQTAATGTISQGGVSGTSGLTSGAGGQGMTGGILESSMSPSTSMVDGFSGAGGTGLQAGSAAPATTNIGLTGGSQYSLTGGSQYSLAGGMSPAASTATQATGASKGTLGKVMDFAQTPAGMNLAGNMMQGMASGDAAQQELDFLQQKYGNDRADLERRLKNINFKYEVIDPNDPQAEAKRQAAKAAGVPTITLGANTNGPMVQPAGVTMNANQMKVA